MMNETDLKDLHQKALRVIRMNHLYEIGNEREAMEMDPDNTVWKDLSEAVPDSFRDMLKLLIQCELFGVVGIDRKDEYIGEAKAVDLLVDWNGTRWDLKIEKELSK